MDMRITLTFFVLIISGCVAMDDWNFVGVDQASTIQSITEFTDDENEVTHIPSYHLLKKIDAFECGNPYLKLCIKSSLDNFDYACLGRILNGSTKMQIELKARSIPEFNCSEKA